MAEIFISYAHHNKAKVQDLAQRLEKHGYSIFYDQDLNGGDPWREKLNTELDAARVVIGVWDEKTVKDSRFTIEECSRAAEVNKLIPVLVDELEVSGYPLGLATLQTINLADDADDGESFTRLLRSIKQKLVPEKLRLERLEQDKALEQTGVRLQPLVSESTTAESTNVATILSEYRKGLIKIPDYQRESNQWDLKTQSIFIESIINNLAIPAFFFEPVKTETGTVVNFIVDGQQRLTTLLDYYDGKFNLLPLGEVPYISPNSGHYAERPFNQLPQAYQSAFEGYRLTIIKLRDLGEQRLEVFRRINQGGTPLSGQDIRLAYYGEKSKSISFIRLTGLMTLESPTTKAVLANARSRWNIEHPWKDAEAFRKWREFWKEPKDSIGQKASEMFMWGPLSADVTPLQALIASKTERRGAAKLELRSGEDLLDLYCAELSYQEAAGANGPLLDFERMSTSVFPVFCASVKRIFGENHIVPFKSRLIGICAGAICALKIDPSKLSAKGVAKLGQFIQAPKRVAKEKGVSWNESSGTWEGKRGWAQQILATHHFVREISRM
jgi:uncharacterized protein DUF262/TIR domain-containing protein